MAVGAVNGFSNSALDYQNKSENIQQRNKSNEREMTTIETKCEKKHHHTSTCSYTSSTAKVDDGTGKGEYVDTSV